MERYWVPTWVVECGVQREGCISMVKYADAQATVEALQAIIKQMGEQACVLAKDGMAAKAQVEALQRERDHAKKMEVMQKEIADNQTWYVRELRTALDAEREKVKGLHEVTKVICAHCCEPMEIPSKAVLQTQLTQLQALVRAFVDHFDGDFENPGLELYGQVNGKEIANGGKALNDLLDKARATLDATTPAPMDAAETHDRMFNHADRHPEAL